MPGCLPQGRGLGEIPGQAAGIAAALASAAGGEVDVRRVEVDRLQRALLAQGALMS